MQQKQQHPIAARQAETLTVNVIGAGRIGMPVIEYILADAHLSLGSVLALQASTHPGVTYTSDADAFFAQVPDVIIDAAGPVALAAYGERALRAADLWSISASAMADREVSEKLTQVASDSGYRLRFLSGAIGALDGVAAAACDSGASISVHIERPCITEHYGEIFAGTAREVALFFPHEANVVAAVALAGKGMDNTHVTLVSGRPGSDHSLTINAASCFGKMVFSVTIAPLVGDRLHPVSASIIAALKQATGVMRIG